MKYLHVFIIYRELQQHNALKDPKNALVMKAAEESNKMDLADVMKVDLVQRTANIVVNNTAGMSEKSMQ